MRRARTSGTACPPLAPEPDGFPYSPPLHLLRLTPPAATRPSSSRGRPRTPPRSSPPLATHTLPRPPPWRPPVARTPDLEAGFKTREMEFVVFDDGGGEDPMRCILGVAHVPLAGLEQGVPVEGGFRWGPGGVGPCLA